MFFYSPQSHEKYPLFKPDTKAFEEIFEDHKQLKIRYEQLEKKIELDRRLFSEYFG